MFLGKLVERSKCSGQDGPFAAAITHMAIVASATPWRMNPAQLGFVAGL
jgi:hypothetical protein